MAMYLRKSIIVAQGSCTMTQLRTVNEERASDNNVSRTVNGLLLYKSIMR